MALQHLRSSTADKRPTPGAMADGQLAINTADASPGLFFKNSLGDLVKVGPVHVGTTAPNATPASGGQAGNSVGEQWLDTTGGGYKFKIWDGTAWRSEDGEFVNVSGDTMTGALGIIAGTNTAPGVFFSGDTNTGIYSPGADQVAVATNGSARLYINSSGSVGIGTTSPNELLEVAGNIHLSGADRSIFNRSNNALTFGTNNSEHARIDSSGRLLVGTSSTSIGCRQVLEGSSGGLQAGIQILAANTGSPADNSALGAIYFADNSHASGTGIGATIFVRRDGGTWTSGTSQPTRLEFSTAANGASSPTERMRVGSNGVHWLFSSDDTMRLRTSNSAGTVYALIRGYYSGTGTVIGGTESLTIWNNGNIVNLNNSYGAISDIKLKENIIDANSQWDDLKALQVRNYNFKEGQTHTQIGLVAQEVELVSPGLVTESPDRDAEGNDLGTVTKSVNYSVLYMKAVKALQEAMERIEQLETEMAAVKAQLS
jgi:hypothetical protein